MFLDALASSVSQLPMREGGPVILEIIDRGAATPEHRAPLLFVHGGMHAAWCWERNFLGFFADRGYRALALSLRGHGASRSPTQRFGCRVGDYVTDVRQVAANLSMPPVVIGHSMGGFVVQKYLESADAPAAVLLASIPPRGTASVVVRAAKRQLVLGAQYRWRAPHRQYADTASPTQSYRYDVLRATLFSVATSTKDIEWCVDKLERSVSMRAVADMAFRDTPHPRRVKAPLLILGADQDGLVSSSQVRRTARAYQSSCEMFAGMGHDMMLEPGWAAVARRIDSWLCELGL